MLETAGTRPAARQGHPMPDGPFLRAIRAAAPDPTPDAELLRRFAAAADHAAFELIVRRHAELVWRVCRGVLRADPHAAEDAFQATFLALARKAGTVARRDLLAGWLFRVARHAALRARKRQQRPDRQGGHGVLDALPDGRASDGSPDLGPVVAEEIDKLAAKFRDPVLLCFFEGHTHAEAAERLGWAVGTVASRLARAKDRLRDRLAARGLAPAAVAAALAAPPASAVPPTLIRTTAAVTAGAAAAPVPVLALTEGALSAMQLAKLKLTAAVAAAVVAAAGGGMTVATWAAAQNPPGGGRAPHAAGAAAKPAPADSPVKYETDPNGATPTKQQKGTGGARRWAQVGNNLKQLAIAFHNYHDTVGHLPTDVYSADGKPLWSWRVQLLPYLDQHNLFKQADLTKPWDDPANKDVSSAVVKVFQCGAEPADRPLTCLKRPTGPGTAHQPGLKVKFADFTDGTSNTLLVVEAGDPVPWAKPGTDFPIDPKNPPTIKGPFAAGLTAARGDGAVVTFPGEIPPASARKLSLIADGEAVAEKDWAGAAAGVPVDPKELAELQKEVRDLTEQAVKGLRDMVALEEAMLRLQAARAEKEGEKFTPALAARALDLYRIVEGLQARRKRLADELGVKPEKLDEVLKEYMTEKK
jgi:RNA polymerase sigma factor (sigma-70 family)